MLKNCDIKIEEMMFSSLQRIMLLCHDSLGLYVGKSETGIAEAYLSCSGM